MAAFLAHPAVQGGLAPFVIGIVVAGLAFGLRLSGIAAAAGFFAAVYLTGGFPVDLRTSMHKIVTLGMAAAAIGAASVMLARVPWFAVAVLGLVPLAVRLPLPERAHPAIQVLIASIYALTIAGASLSLTWVARRA